METKIEEASAKNINLEDAKNQIKAGNKIIGTSEVTGPGITITFTDIASAPAFFNSFII